MWTIGCLLVLAMPMALAQSELTENPATVPTTANETEATMANNTTARPTGNTHRLKIRACDLCNCTVDVLDCSGRKLNESVFELEYPSTPYQVFNFSYNNISQVRPLPAVQVSKLILCHNAIKAIHDHSFKSITNLTELDLSYNLLTYDNVSPHAFRGRFSSESYEPLRKLRKLDLSHNKFTSLKSNIFEHVMDLKSLSLSHNPLSLFDTPLTLAIHELSYLEELDMSHCQLKDIDAAVLHNHKFCKTLDISYNEFKELPHVLEDVNSLETLVLDGNPIEKLTGGNSFPAMASLKRLFMRNMSQLVSIGKGSMCQLQALEVLLIENCPNLTEIDEFAFAKEGKEGGAIWPPLKTLNITNNALKYLPANLVARWEDLEELHITNNKWNCDCDNQDLIGIILPPHGERLMGNETSELRCAAPLEHFNQSLESLATWKLRCPDLYGARPERDAALLVGMLIGVILAVPLVLVFFVLWRKGFFFFGTQSPASFSRAFYKRAPPYEDDIYAAT